MRREQFIKLIDRYLLGKASQKEEDLIDNFFNLHESGQNPFQDVSEEMWSSLQKKLDYSKKSKNEIISAKRSTGFSFMKQALVSSLILLIAGTGIFGIYRFKLSPKSETTLKWATVATNPGEKLTLTLPDRSVLQLNSVSSVSYPEKFTSSHREIILKGEAFFEVSPDVKKPFIVRTGEVTTKVLGTSFNIKAFPDEKISVTVASGKVEVSAAGQYPPGKGDTEGARVMLAPRLQAVYDPDQKSITTSMVGIESFLAWKSNTLLFDGTSMEEAAITLERWYDVTIEFENEAVKRCHIHGQYKDQSFSHVLESIGYMYHIDYKFVNKNHVIFYGKGCP